MGVRTLDPHSPPTVASEEAYQELPAHFPTAVLAILAAPDTVEVMSVSPFPVVSNEVDADDSDDDPVDRVGALSAEQFKLEANRPGLIHGYRIRGTVRVPTPERRRAVGEALAEANRSATPGAMCFDPHFAVRATRAGQVVDSLICFKCGNVHVVGPENHAGMYPIGPFAAPLLRQELRRGGVGWLWFWRRWLGGPPDAS